LRGGVESVNVRPMSGPPRAATRDPIRVAVLGTSFGGTVQAVGFDRHPDYRLVAMAGTDPARTATVAGRHDGVQPYVDWRRLIAEVRPDLVSIVTPVDLHHPMTLAALEASAHVLCEKPTAMHRFQALEMRDRARDAGRVAAIHHEFRFFPARRHALERVREGAIGRPRRGVIIGRNPVWTLPSTRAMTWLSDRARGGGILGALGSHHVDCLRTFFGEPADVLASVRTQQPHRGPTPTDPRTGVATSDDAFTLDLRFANGVTGLVDVDATTPYRFERFEILGDEAALRWDETGYHLWRVAPGREPEELPIPPGLALARREGDPPLVAPFTALIGRLATAIRDGVAMSPDLDDALAVQSVLDAARESSAAGARVLVSIPGLA
jgi:predicted dehydrogenase